MKVEQVKLSRLVPNTGQVPGLPINPRQWTASDIDKIANSLLETPELFEARPIIAYPLDEKTLVILGGNLRYEGAKRNKMKEVPCIILPAEMPVEKMKQIVIKDNGSFGAWDYDILANEWDDLPLADWGVPAWDPEPVDESAVDALFEESQEEGKKPASLVVVAIPAELEDKQEDIIAALRVTLEEWPEVTIR